MRTLLVDNHDSFTYNLFHYLAEVNGQEPVVITNDEPGWSLGELGRYDNVVISPGPGTPLQDEDLGLSREIIRRCRLPLLGVCLGHQALAYEAGGVVARAPEPRHGRRSPVLHRGEGLFAGLPSPFEAVRYHSLAVTKLPADLAAIAWTPDDVLMGVAHRTRPMWGVQFHPESIHTEHGQRLLANFGELTRQRGRAHLPAPVRVVASRTRAGIRPVRRLRLLTRAMPTRADAEMVFDRLFRDRPHAFWLDSSRVDERTGRLSIMGDATGPLARIARADAWHDTVTIESGNGIRVITTRFLDWLEGDLRGIHLEAPALPFDFALGWIGYLGYELKAQCGARRAHRSRTPDAEMVFADRAVVFDHAAGTTHLLVLTGEASDSAARAWLRDTASRLAEFAGTVPARPATPTVARPLTLRHRREHYLDRIDDCLKAIAAGETYEVCLTNMVDIPGPIDAWSSYRHLRHAHPTPFSALLQFGAATVVSTSPERFLKVSGDRTVESKPIKGTRPRGRSPRHDAALRRELASSEKDRAENLMIVDLVRHDLGRVAEVGSVRVDELFTVETYAAVHQLVSTVRAKLRAGSSAVTCARAAFPGGSMTGTPKLRTMSIIDNLEDGPRGVYSGAIGYFSLSGAADLSIAIRTLVITPQGATYGVGGAITALSDPAAEFEETAVKAAPILDLFDAEFPDRTR